MAKITRKTQKIFGGGLNPTNNIAQFGSLKAGAPTYSADLAVIQSLAAWLDGWAGALVNNSAPALQDENAVAFVVSSQLAYLLQTGIPEWDAGTTYYIGSVVQDGTGGMYRSKTDTNLNHALTDTDNWTPLAAAAGKNSPYGSIPIGAVLATFPNLTGAYSCTATTVADALGYVKCGGQTISDATSPLNGQVVPNINSSVFLMGYTTAGNTGGASSYNLAHVHTIAHIHQYLYTKREAIYTYNGGFTELADAAAKTTFTHDDTDADLSDGIPTFTTGTLPLTTAGISPAYNVSWYTASAINASGAAASSGAALSSSTTIIPPYITALYVMRVK